MPHEKSSATPIDFDPAEVSCLLARRARRPTKAEDSRPFARSARSRAREPLLPKLGAWLDAEYTRLPARCARSQNKTLCKSISLSRKKASGRLPTAIVFFSYHQAETKEWPNIAFQPTPLRVERDRADFVCYHVLKAFPIHNCGAAERQRWTATILTPPYTVFYTLDFPENLTIIIVNEHSGATV